MLLRLIEDRVETASERGRVGGDGDPLVARFLAADNRDAAERTIEQAGEKSQQRVVGRAFDRGRGKPNQQRVAARTGDAGSPGARDDTHGERGASRGVDGERNQAGLPWPPARRCSCGIGDVTVSA